MGGQNNCTRFCFTEVAVATCCRLPPMSRGRSSPCLTRCSLAYQNWHLALSCRTTRRCLFSFRCLALLAPVTGSPESMTGTTNPGIGLPGPTGLPAPLTLPTKTAPVATLSMTGATNPGASRACGLLASPDGLPASPRGGLLASLGGLPASPDGDPSPRSALDAVGLDDVQERGFCVAHLSVEESRPASSAADPETPLICVNTLSFAIIRSTPFPNLRCTPLRPRRLCLPSPPLRRGCPSCVQTSRCSLRHSFSFRSISSCPRYNS